MRFISLLLSLTLPLAIFSQKKFQGVLTYKITIQDTSLLSFFPIQEMKIYTNDTLIRIETESILTGKQIQIKHLEKKKSLLLMDTEAGKFALQIIDTNDQNSKYNWVKGKGKTKTMGQKVKYLTVKNKLSNHEYSFAYAPKLNSKYLPGFNHFPGLLTDYLIETIDGIYRYELINIESKKLDKALFGVPTTYKIISMNDFIEQFTKEQTIE